MKKSTIFIIATSVFIGFISWGASQIVVNKTDISSIKQASKYDHELLKEMRTDIKQLLQRK